MIKILAAAKKPLVAQNPQYDMAFVYEQFIGPLPPTFIEFCVEWKKYFPILYDTKCVSIELTGADKGGKTNLEDLYAKC